MEKDFNFPKLPVIIPKLEDSKSFSYPNKNGVIIGDCLMIDH